MNELKRIHVTFKSVTGGYQLVFNAEGADRPFESDIIPEDTIKQERNRLTSVLHEVSELWWKTDPLNGQMSIAGKAIKTLHEYSLVFLKELFGKKATDRLTDYLTLGNQSELKALVREQRPLGLIVYEAPIDSFLPLEYLFLSSDDFDECPCTFHKLMDSLSHMLGYAYIIRRVPASRHASPRSMKECFTSVTIEYDSLLKVDIFAHFALRSTVKEIAFFDEANSHVFSLLAKPNPKDRADAEAIVRRMNGESNAHLYHFCCHCDVTSSDAWKHSLRINADVVKLAELQYHSERQSSQISSRRPCWKTTFLNACDSSNVPPLATSSFAGFFLDLPEQVGYVGTESRMNDSYAYEIARVIYANWLECRDLGMAIFKTRWYFAKYYENLAALLYAYYARDDVRLQGPPRLVHL